MESTAVKPVREKFTSPPTPTSGAKTSTGQKSPASLPDRLAAEKAVGYGLPCSNCHAYYPADMQSCPICKNNERVSPTAPVIHSAIPEKADGATTTEIDEERERFLKELKSQAFATHTQIDAAATFRCVLGHQHAGATEPAAVCHSCYSAVRQQSDRTEAALLIDGKEAAKIVYEAVWADTSDPGTTYLNAANALLSELRKRAGIGLILGKNQPLAH